MRSLTSAGPLIGGYVFAAQGWQWTQWVTVMLALAVYLLGIGMPETYPREIIRARARRLGVPHNMVAAASGTTLQAMLRITLFTPLKMLFSEALVIGISLYLGLNFAVIFSFFVSIPVVLHAVYSFDIQQVGLAFIAAITGSLLAAATSIFIDRLTRPETLTENHDGALDIEYRLYPAMLGGFGITASLFWIGWTAGPNVRWASPVVGTLLYVWGNLSVLVRALLPRAQRHAAQSRPDLVLSLLDLPGIIPLRRLPGGRDPLGPHGRRVFAPRSRRRPSARHPAE